MKDAVQGQAIGLYDNGYAIDNVFGHALALLRKHSTVNSRGRIHLDIGCGYGRLAEPLTAELGLAYVGCDAGEDGLASLRSRGFEAHSVRLAGKDETYAALSAVVAGRPLASITMLDTLEHLADGDATLAAIHRLAAEQSALVLISVPNVAHRDVGFRLAFGRWDYTEAGLLDHTHMRLFGWDVLERVLHSAGLYPFDENDVHRSESDQHFPTEHPALARGALLHDYLSRLRERAAPASDVNQFVRICAPGRPSREDSFRRPALEPKRPFLSVVMRTQGRRSHTMAEAMTALAGQSNDDFEVVVVGHRLTLEEQIEVERVLEDNPDDLKRKCRFIRIADGGRARPLNEGFAAASGRYIAALDDDDVPLGHWVETFRGLEREAPGRLLRAVAARQNVVTTQIAGRKGLRATGPIEKLFASKFDVLEHLSVNQTPNLAVAFPRGLFHDLGLRFDETLTTTEDWDFLMRSALIVGVASSPEITSIYRWWVDDESSRSVHTPEEWRSNYELILRKMDEAPVLLPRGTLGRVRQILSDGSDGRIKRLKEIFSIINSSSWRAAAPLRFIGRAIGRPSPDLSRMWTSNEVELAELAQELRTWKSRTPLRRLRRRIKKLRRKGR